jgi:hypothetical protein
MTTKSKKKEAIQTNKSGAEKPVSLWGASFTEVLAALLKTRPMPKEYDQKKQTEKK